MDITNQVKLVYQQAEKETKKVKQKLFCIYQTIMID